jgi:hypothetical protein
MRYATTKLVQGAGVGGDTETCFPTPFPERMQQELGQERFLDAERAFMNERKEIKQKGEEEEEGQRARSRQ